ncbi:outer membrane protein transport protein [Belnapia sp. T18]|uniref:Outer membrane protein transport protein n=1 Tax=Belnapia arida TaxID=2804533 RepID=A0ABS1UDE8_9PROT|nr:outer membrane protein transport protein [Belnapia arida]MBL6082693.1 outer membrane protein transport protein [Belnapia arida]
MARDNKRHGKRAIWLPVPVAVSFFTMLADASGTGFELREQSATSQGASLAGAAAKSDDPSFLYFNSASMAWLPGTQAAVVGSGVFGQLDAQTGSASRTAAVGSSAITGSLGRDAAQDAFVPALHGSVALGERWHLGISVTSPWGLVTKYPADFIGRYHALTSSLRTINITPSVAWRPLPNLAVGAGLQIQYADARLSQAVDLGAVGFLNPALRRAGFRPGVADSRATVTGDDTAFGWQVGAQWRPIIGTQLGAAFRSAIFHNLGGDARFDGVPTAVAAGFASARGQAKLATPESLTLGFSQQIGERWTLLTGAEWTNWSRFRDLVVRFDDGRAPSVTQERWRDSWFLSLGAEYRVNDALVVRSGIAWDQTPVPNGTRTPRIPDTDRYWLSTGASWQPAKGVTFSAAYTHIVADEARVRLRDSGPGTDDFLRGDLTTNYSASVDIVSIQASFAF